MTAPLQTTDTPPASPPLGGLSSGLPIVTSVARRSLDCPQTPDRKLRNRIILANALVWLLVAFALAVTLS
jgi:hypothetical protein